MKKEEDKWYKNKGYPHLTNAYNLTVQNKGLKSKIQDPNFVAKYAFFPLFHINIKNRRYCENVYGLLIFYTSYFISKIGGIKNQKTVHVLTILLKMGLRSRMLKLDRFIMPII